jgi:TetR/AcrR family transcriptional regulator
VSERRDGASSDGSIAPLYRRLPRGPHKLAPTEVAHHQRIRMHGAMVEAVAANGYARTSVKQVIGLAGVSRRAFYEQFSNKQECFLATFDLIAARGAKHATEAFRASSGDVEERLRASYEVLTEGVGANPKGASLAIVEAQTTGAVGLAHLRRAAAAFEQMLCRTFASDPHMQALPVPVARAIVGGMHEALAVRLRTGRTGEIPALSEEMLAWTMLFQAPSLGRLPETLAQHARAAEPSSLLGGFEGEPRGGNLRERLLKSMLQLAAMDDYKGLSAPQIAEHAGVAPELFFDHFESKEECFLAAFDDLAGELLLAAADPGLDSGDWPAAVHRSIREMMDLLAERPLYAHTIARIAPGAGKQALERDYDLARKIGSLLTDGAPKQTHSELTDEGISGALWHTIRCQVVSNQIHLLPAFADYLAYVALTPFIGAEDAADVVLEGVAREPALSAAGRREPRRGS